MAYRRIAQHGILFSLVLSSLTACSTVDSLTGGDRFDYKSSSKKTAPSLEVPPDLTQLQNDNRYAIPGANGGTATASTYNQHAQNTQSSGPQAVAPNALGDMHIERDGSERWLVVKQPAEVLWPKIKQFWEDNGFVIKSDSPKTGVMETDWAENRAKIPGGIIRDTLGKVFDSAFSTGERDKFRTRIERGADGTSEIYISHRGAQEELTGPQKDGVTWTSRPSDPGLEAEFLSRLMAFLANAKPAEAKQVAAQAVAEPPKATLVSTAGIPHIEMSEGFEQAWRRVGLALDRVGFTVEDRDRTRGLYFVRYAGDADGKGNGKGFFSRLFGSNDDNASTQKYQIAVKSGSANSEVTVLDNDGKALNSPEASKILSLLEDQLK